MSQQPNSPPLIKSLLPQSFEMRFEILSALLLIAIGGVSMVGWAFHLPGVVQLQTGYVAMVFNTALLFTLSGVLLLCRKPAIRVAIAAVIVAIAAITSAQYPLHLDFHIDQLLVHTWITDPNPYPGRLAPQTGICFVIAGISFFLLDCKPRRWISVVVHLSAITLSVAGILSLIGYSIRLELLYSWYSYTRMALQTAAAFTILAIGLWLRWYRTGFSAGDFAQHQQRRINVIGIAIIVLVATTASAAGFVTLARQTETIALNGITNTLHGYVQALAVQIEERRSNAQTIRNSPQLNPLLKGRGKPREIESILESFLQGNITGITIYSQDGQIVSRVGKMVDQAAMTIPLNEGTRLLWNDQATLRIERPIMIEGLPHGTAIVEARFILPSRLIADTARVGTTGDLRICSIVNASTMQCLPTRLDPNLYLHAPRTVDGQSLPVSLAAEGKSGALIFRNYRNQQSAGAYAPVDDTGLGVALFQNTEDLYAPIRDNLQIMLLILGLVVTGAIILLRWQIAPLLQQVVLSRAEAAASATRIAAIMNNVPEGILTVDSRGCIVSFNSAITQLFGYSAAELQGANIQLLMPPAMHAAHAAGFSRYLKTQEPRLIGRGPVELPAKRRDGSEFPIELTLAEMVLNGERCFVGIMHDITKRREIDRLKNEFISVVSHELRTPLTSIRGSLGLVNGGTAGALPEKARQLIAIAYRNTDRLAHLINDILDIEGIEAGRLQLDLKVQALRPLIEEALEVNAGYAHHHQVHFVMPSPIPDVYVNVDAHRLLQVMANLLSNATKFSPLHTNVEIGVVVTPATCRVWVRDHGPGVPADFHSKIFGKFCQANSSDQRTKTGTGLGLTISKAIVEQLGGMIGYETAPGEGAMFFFELPLSVAINTTLDRDAESHAA